MKRLIALLILTATLVCAVSCGPRSAGGEPYGVGRGEIAASADSPDATTGQGTCEGDAIPSEFTVVMVGDVLLHEPIVESGLADDGYRSYDHLFANVRDAVADADLALVNEEVILGGEELGLSGYPRFNGPFEVGDAEAAAGFDVILQATNHALDRGGDGIKNDLAFWRENYPEIAVTGIYDSAEARAAICVVELHDVRVAVLNYTYSTNRIEPPADMPWAVAMLDENEVVSDLRRARELADFVIVCPHWGTEYSHEVSDYQRKWAQIFADNGADLIIGAHPHVIQPLGEVNSADGRAVPVFWSVGNFINSTAESGHGVADRMLGAMASVTLSVTRGPDGSVSDVAVKTAEALPLVTHLVFGYLAPTTYFLDDYTESLAAESQAAGRDPSFSLAYLRSLWSSVMSDQE